MAIPKLVSDILAKVLLPTFAELREEAEKQKALTRAPARSTKTSHHPRTPRTLPKRANSNR